MNEREIRAQAWAEGFLAAWNKDFGRDPSTPAAGDWPHLIDSFNPYTGEGSIDPFEDDA